MHVLFLSNFYPPSRPGGYSQWCHEVAETLKSRGHTIGVLTTVPDKAVPDEKNVYRLLHLENEDLLYYKPMPFFTKRRKHEKQDLVTTRQVIESFHPDIVFVWGMWALSRTLPAYIEQRGHPPVAYYVSDHWPSDPDMHTVYWKLPANHLVMRLPKKLLAWLAFKMLAAEGKPVNLRFDHAICVSAAVRDNLVKAGLASFRHAQVIHGGTDVARFLQKGRREQPARRDSNLALLYAGRMVQHKGVHTAIEAMTKLVHEEGAANLKLTLVGSGRPDYEARLRDLVAREGLDNYVTFHGRVSREEMPELMQQFDVLVFPSIYEEPLARMTQEAMVSGLVVVGTTTGGTKEILEDGVNSLTFAPEDADGLACQIKRLAVDPDLRHRLSETGRQTVLEKFALTRMVDEIEAYLREILTQ